MRRGSKGRKIQDREVSEILTIYNLCKEFSKLPSEIEDEDEKTMNQMIIVFDEIQKVKEKERKKLERKSKQMRRKVK